MTSKTKNTGNDGSEPASPAKSPNTGPDGEDWTAPLRASQTSRPDDDGTERLCVDIEGYEGPLDVLLALARTQKLDLANISILAIVEQYLTFITDARRLQLELAADYLVMAAWLAFLKSRLLLPREAETGEELSAEDMARRLSFRLLRLDAMRARAAELMARPRLDRDVYGRGWRETVEVKTTVRYDADLTELLQAYARQRQKRVSAKSRHSVARRKVWSIKQARDRLEDLVGLTMTDWVALDQYLDYYLATPEDLKTVRAASFGASLEMARDGNLELRQDGAFQPLYMRRCEPPQKVDRSLGARSDAEHDAEGDAQ
ncbi:MAG: ScpA family protein [Pseudomonadota bacterium]